MAQRLNYGELAPEATAALRAVEHVLNTASGLEGSLLELVRLRASLLNGCEYCIGLHTHELAKRHEPKGRLDEVAQWRVSGAYTERERAALGWTEAVTDVQVGHVPDEAFAAAREHFSEADLANLTVAIASINAWNRMAIAFRAERRRIDSDAPAPGNGGRASAGEDDDGGKVSVEE